MSGVDEGRDWILHTRVILTVILVKLFLDSRYLLSRMQCDMRLVMNIGEKRLGMDFPREHN